MFKPCKSKPERVINAFSKILKRLPSTYPKTILIIHNNLKNLQSYYWETSGTSLDPGDPGHSPFAYCDGDDYSIHVSPSLNRVSTIEVVWYLLHEIGHLKALYKFGEKDPRWKDYKISEQYANKFADRWCDTLKKEGFFKTI